MEEPEGLINNNAKVSRPFGADRSTSELLNKSDAGPGSKRTKDGELSQTLSTMQKFMPKKGIIDKPMGADELRSFLENEEENKQDMEVEAAEVQPKPKTPRVLKNKENSEESKGAGKAKLLINCCNSTSESQSIERLYRVLFQM